MLCPSAHAQEPRCYCAAICGRVAAADRCHVEGCRPLAKQAKKVFYIGSAALAASTVADAISTRQLLNRGGFEMNPIYGKRPSPAKQAGINAAFFAGSVGVFYLTERSHSRVIRWAGRSWIGLQTAQHSYLAACNSAINVRAPVQQTCGPLVPF